MAEFDRAGCIAWVSDIADIPELQDVNNVYGDLGQIFANGTVAARQIEGPAPTQDPEDTQKRYGFASLGAANGPVKTAIFSGNSARLFKLEQHATLPVVDPFAELKRQAPYAANGLAQSNVRYGNGQRSA